MDSKTLKRFWAKVRLGPGCWEWTGSTHHEWKYGHVRVDGKTCAAHRVSWEIHNGPIPSDLRVLHRCDNPPCVRPDHLFLGTDADNAHDRDTKGRCRTGIHNTLKTHCPKGHEYTAENTKTFRNAKGWTMRQCRECARAHSRANYMRHRAERRAAAKVWARARRERNPETFKRQTREYARASRARRKAAREAAGILPAPQRYPLRERTTCAKGHPHTPENTRMYKGKRVCRACMRAFHLKYKAQRQAITHSTPRA